MLAPSPKTLVGLSSKELREEADRLLALYEERPEDLVYHYRDAGGAPVFPIVARHVELVGAHLWSGVGLEKNAERPHREWHWSDTLKTYLPERLPDPVIEPPAPAPLEWATPKLVEIFNPPLIKQHADEPPLPARCLTWNTPTIVQVGAEHLLDFMQDAIKARTLPTQVFTYLAARRRAVPGLVPESARPVEAALHVALWAQAHAGTRPLWGTSAGVAIDHALRIAARLTAGRRRLHLNLGDEASADWGLLLMTTLGGLSARKAAQHVDLGRDVVAKRLRVLLGEIETSLGILSLNGQIDEFAKRVGKRIERTDDPKLSLARAREAPLPAPWERLPSDTHTKRVCPDDRWLIAEAIEYWGGPTKLPPGCADGVAERVRDLDIVKRGDPDDDELPIVGHTTALRTEGRLYPRSTDWRAVARELPPGPDRDAALERERTIARLLADDTWPQPAYWPTKSKPTKRWGATWQQGDDIYRAPPDVPPIKPIISWPRAPIFQMPEHRSDDIGDDNFSGAVTARNGELTARRHDNSPRVKRDIFDRFADAASRMDESPQQ